MEIQDGLIDFVTTLVESLVLQDTDDQKELKCTHGSIITLKQDMGLLIFSSLYPVLKTYGQI